jgi:hypothetical protein
MGDFTLAERVHRRGDARCPGCLATFPERCRCGGFVHATGLPEAAEPAAPPVTQCDQCGRSSGDLTEEVA